MVEQSLTQKDLDLLGDTGSSEDKAADLDKGSDKASESADKQAEKGADKGSEKPAAKGGSLFDGLDDEGGDKPEPKGGKKSDPVGAEAETKAGEGDDDKKATDAKGADETDEQKRERLAADAQWRDRIADKILAPLKEKLTAKKFEQRREQLVNQLKRAKSIDDAVVSGILAQEKLRSGDHKKLADGATPEEAAAWRKENDVPEAPDKYEIPAIPGHSWTDKDQPQIDSARATAHSVNLTQAQFNTLVDWQIKDQQRVAEQMDADLKAADAEDKDACFDQIRSEFGVREFKPHMAAMKRLIEDDEVFGTSSAEKIMSARYFDEETGLWRRLTSIPGVARGLIGLALDRYGDVSMPSGDARNNNGKSRLDEIQKVMNTDIDRYYREGLADEALKIQQEAESKASRRTSRAAR